VLAIYLVMKENGLIFRKATFSDHDALFALYQTNTLAEFALCPYIEEGKIVVGLMGDVIAGFVAVEQASDKTIRIIFFALSNQYLEKATDFLIPCFAIFPDHTLCIASQKSDDPLAPILRNFQLIRYGGPVCTYVIDRAFLLSRITVFQEDDHLNILLGDISIGNCKIRRLDREFLVKYERLLNMTLDGEIAELESFHVVENSEAVILEVLRTICREANVVQLFKLKDMSQESLLRRFFYTLPSSRDPKVRVERTSTQEPFQFEPLPISDDISERKIIARPSIFDRNSKPKIPSPSRLVIVSNSDTAFYTVKALLENNLLEFYAITLLSADSQNFPESLMDIEIRNSKICHIDIVSQSITLESNDQVFYDYLVIASDLVDTALTSMPKASGAIALTEPNLMNLLETRFLQTLHWNPLSYCVIYGSDFHTFQIIHWLLASKVDPKKISLIIPNSSTERYDDKPLLDFLMEKLTNIGVTVYRKDRGYSLKSLDIFENKLRGAVFASGEELLELKCRVLLSKYSTSIEEVYHMDTPELLVDGRFMVSAAFETMNPRVFACGESAVFPNQVKQIALNKKEIGFYMAQVLISKIAPSFAEFSPKEQRFDAPLVTSGEIPGNLFFHRLSANGLYKAARCEIISTNTLGLSSGCIFEVHLDRFGRINCIVYIGHTPLIVESLEPLIGLPESLLNNLRQRWSEGRVTDILEYLAQNWAKALFHPDLPRIIDEVNQEKGNENEEIKSTILNFLNSKKHELIDYAI
jgi:hypothetical protein